MMDIKEMKSKVMALEPLVRIGKSGLTDSVIGEIKKQLDQKKLIKIKLLKSFVGGKDRKAVVKEIVERTGSQLVHNVGFIVVISKK